MDLGFLGLGQMGAAIAERHAQAGARLHVFDPDPVAIAPFVLNGAVDHASARAVADAATIGSRAMRAIADQMQAHGITLIDCPISGGPKGARAGTLSVIAAGPQAV